MCRLCSEQNWPPLTEKLVILATSGSISIYRVPDIIREIRRKGGDVKVGMSESSAEMISPELIKWASSNAPVTKITGFIEHISLFTEPRDKILLICPLTYDTAGKMASGISDNIPSLFFSFAFGHGVPVLAAPAMHLDMYRNKFMQENIKRLMDSGVEFIEPEEDPEKAKLSEKENIVDHVIRSFYHSTMGGKRVLIISGRTEDRIDPARTVSNRSSGFTGYWLARNSFRLGSSDVTFVGNSPYPMPEYVRSDFCVETASFYSKVEAILRKEKFDLIIIPAAISDFSISFSEKKLDSDREHEIHLKPRKKLLDIIRKNSSAKLVAFRLSESPDDAMRHFSESVPDMIVHNSILEEPFGNGGAKYSVISGEKITEISGASKEEVTFRLLLHIMGSLFALGKTNKQ